MCSYFLPAGSSLYTISIDKTHPQQGLTGEAALLRHREDMMLRSLSRPLPAIVVQRRSLTSGCTQKQPGKYAKISLICASAFSMCATAAGMLTICEADKLERWQNRWAAGRTAWHRSEPDRSLVKHYERFLGTSDKRKMTEKRRILVPLCGKTIDMPYMAERGHEVLGVEGIEAAAWQLQRDSWLKFDISQVKPSYASAGGDAKAPAFIAAHTFDKQCPGYVFKTDTEGTGYYLDVKPIKWFRDTRKRISLVIHDFFRLTPSDIGTFDRIWDRGSLVAINPSDREAYVATCDSLLQPEGHILLVTLVYDQEKMKGPPYSVSPVDVHRLYGKLGYKVETLDSVDARNDYQGHKWHQLQKTGLEEMAFLLTKPPSSRGTPGWFARIFLGRKPRQH